MATIGAAAPFPLLLVGVVVVEVGVVVTVIDVVDSRIGPMYFQIATAPPEDKG